MKRIYTIDQYKDLLKENKENSRGGLTNNYLGIHGIKKYISLERMYFETMEKGYVIYLDEGKYYRMLYCGRAENINRITPKDKPLMFRFIYDKNTDKKQEWDNILSAFGLSEFDNTIQICANISEQHDVDVKLAKSTRFIERFGLGISYATQGMIDEIFRLRDTEPVLSIYHFEYETESEICEDIVNGLYRVVTNKDNEVVAAQHFIEKNGTINGEWLAVKEEYKLQYGIGGALAYHSFDYAKQKGVDMYYGWVDIKNENSLKYHESLGYRMTGKMSESWIMEAKNEQ